MAVDAIAKKWNILVEKEKFDALVGEGMMAGEKVMLVKPQTYMNLSGESVSKVLNFYKVSPENLIVIYDDIDIALGTLRIRPSGSAGTHNGMRNIVSLLGTTNFPRIRMGTGKDTSTDLRNYVLSPFQGEEKQTIQEVAKMACEAAEEIVKHGVSSAMNLYNGHKKED